MLLLGQIIFVNLKLLIKIYSVVSPILPTPTASCLLYRDVLRFAVPTGCAAKLLPTPHLTLHKLLHLPIQQSNSKDLALLGQF